VSGKGFENELARAFARPDIEKLRRSFDIYYHWTKLSGKEKEESFPDELGLWFFNDDDRDSSLALIALAMASTDDEEFLIGVACGLLESTLSHRPAIAGVPLSEEFLQRIVDEAKRTPRFRWMLSAMWTTGMPEHEAQMIADAVGTARCETDPLPLRPWA
jgi:hypothetical protein